MGERQSSDRPTVSIGRRTLLAGVAALLAGCARRAADPPLTFWAMGYEGDYAPVLMPAFTARTGLAVEAQTLPWTAAHEKLLTAFAGGALPDVMMLPAGWVPEFAMIGAIAPLDDPALTRDLVPGLMDLLRYRGRDHAVPWSVASQMQFYRRDLLAEVGYDAPPQHWDGWRDLGLKLKRRRPDAFAFLMLLNWWDTLFTFAGQIGVPLLREANTRGNFRTAEFARALDFYASLFRDGLAPAVLSTEVQDPFAAFAQGYFAIYPYGPSLLLDLDRRKAELPRERWDVARMPGPNGPGPSSAINGSLAVARTSTRPAAARALLAHLASPASELRFQRMIGNLPARASAWSSPQLSGPALQPFAEQIRFLTHDPAVVEWERIRIEVQLVAERVVRGDLTIPAAQAAMDARVDALLAKRRALVEAGRIA